MILKMFAVNMMLKDNVNFKIYDATTSLTNNYNISQSKSNQTMKICQVIEHNNGNIFFKNHSENKAGRLTPNLRLFLKKIFI